MIPFPQKPSANIIYRNLRRDSYTAVHETEKNILMCCQANNTATESDEGFVYITLLVYSVDCTAVLSNVSVALVVAYSVAVVISLHLTD